MTMIRNVRAEPGGRVVLSFGFDGFSADRETWSDKVERWGETLFGNKKLLIALGLAILLSFPAGLAIQISGESDTVIWAVTPVPLLLLLYVLAGGLLRAAGEALAWVLLIVSLPFLVIPSYRRWLFGSRPPIQQRRGFVHAGSIGQGRVNADGRSVTVALYFSNGAQARYRARGEAGQNMAAEFQRLLGNRLVHR
ncbi:MAG TPA: hypothetical protein VIL71_00220 [Spirillospora sp.]